MRFAVHLDREPGFEATEVELIPSLRCLTAKLETAGASAKLLPEQNLGQAHPTAQYASLLNMLDRRTKDFGLARAPSTALRAVPLPVPGRNVVTRARHIRNTPKRGASGIGALSVAAKARPSTSLVCAGSMMPSSHSLAVACQGDPCAS